MSDNVLTSGVQQETIIKKDFAEIVFFTRNVNGLSFAEMAKMLNVSPSFLCRIEQNKRKADYNFIRKFQKTFDIDVNEFADKENVFSLEELLLSFPVKLEDGSKKVLSFREKQNIVNSVIELVRAGKLTEGSVTIKERE